MNYERNKLPTFIAVEWTRNQRVFTNHGRNGQELPPPEPRTARTLSWMAWAGEEEERGYRPGLFCPGWRHQPEPNPLHLSWLVAPTGTKGPGDQWSRMEPPTGTNIGTKEPRPISPCSSPRPSHWAQCSCCSWLGWGEFLPISSTICEDSLILCPLNSYKG